MSSNPSAPRSKRRLASVVLMLGAVAGAFYLGVRFAEFEAQDDCLDRGGRWGAGVCEGVRPST